MPTNYLRRGSKAPPRSHPPPDRAQHEVPPQGQAGSLGVRLTAGQVVVAIRLAQTEAVRALLAALPLFSKAEPWGECVHFEIPLRLGRDRTARRNGRLGEVYLWTEESRILLPFGPTPISRAGEVRLPAPCNVIGEIDDWAALKGVRPSDKVHLERETG